MDKKTISTMKKMFDDIMHTTEDGTVEFWYARELMGCLGYTTWRRFKDAINRAMESCKSAEIEVSDHFADAVKMVGIGSNAVRDVEDIMLTRYACYLIAQNGDPRKEEIAFAQSYFAVQTRKQELICNNIPHFFPEYPNNDKYKPETFLSFMYTGNNFNKSRLSGTIFTHQGMHLIGLQLKLNTIQCFTVKM